jgi:hypothetical protein
VLILERLAVVVALQPSASDYGEYGEDGYADHEDDASGKAF